MITQHAHDADHAYLTDEDLFHEAGKNRPTTRPQSCNYCDEPATKSFLWAEGKAYIPACPKHHQETIDHIRKEYDDEPDAVHTVRKSAKRRFTPTRRIFGPTYGLDKRLFSADHLKHDVLNWILGTIDSFWAPRYGSSWMAWARVYFAGSEASEWTSAELIGNNDFDVLIGVDYDIARQHVVGFQGASDEEITAELNRQFRELLIPVTDPVWIPVPSTSCPQGSNYPKLRSKASSQRTAMVDPRWMSQSSSQLGRRLSSGYLTELESTDGPRGDLGSAQRVAYVNRRRSRLRNTPASDARQSIYETAISSAHMGSHPSSSTRSLLSKEADVDSVVAATFSSWSIMTIGAAQGNEPVADVSEAFSAPDTTKHSPTSVRTIFAPESSGWTAESPPPAPDGWEYIGPFSATFYVNQDSYDIRDIKPYAAYDVTRDRWAVRPPHLPEWSAKDLPKGFVDEAHAVEDYVRAVLKLPEPYRSQQGDALWRHLHSDRSRAFGPQGEGWYDPGNALEKWLDQAGLWEKLADVHFDCVENPHKLLAPVNWSNDPRAAG